MNRPLLLALVLPLALSAPPAFAGRDQPAHPMHAAPQPAKPAPRLQTALRSLWHDHVVHAREYAYAVHAGKTKAAAKADAAVVSNAKQIANTVGGFYGDAGGRRMLELLGGHWGAIKHLTDAAHAGDIGGRNAATGDLTANAKDIATFLSGANPNLPQNAVFGLLAAHGAQIDQIMKGDRKGEAATWMMMQKHMDTIADTLAGAIAKQFPAKAK